MTNRIESLRKQKIMEEMFAKKGLSPTLADIKVTVKEDDNGRKQFKKLVSSVKRKQVPKYLALSTEEKIKFINEVSTGYLNVQVTPIIMEETEHGPKTYWVKLLRSMGELRYKTLKEVEEEFVPVTVTFQYGDQKPVEAISLLNAKFPTKVHNNGWRLIDVRGKYDHIMDMTQLLPEAIALNELEKFARSNEELIKYLTIRYIADLGQYKDCSYLPMNPKFSMEVVNELKKHDLLRAETKSYDFIDNYEAIYQLEKDTKGFVREIYHRSAFDIIVPEFLSQMNYARESGKMEISARADYAKSFQTKKHINKQTQERMKQNAFLKHYNFVELDNEVDLKLFSKIEKDFIQFNQHFAVPKAMDHSFRIKKLGHYRAAGVYFPYFKATILDLDSPDSYAHELAHQMDYSMSDGGQLISEKPDFRPIIDLYRTAADQAIGQLPSGNKMKDTWNGTTKYNKQYYFQPTEIFARSFELYLHDLGIETSFLKKSYDAPQYPKDAAYRKQITAYFKNLFKDTPPIKEQPIKKEKKKVMVEIWEPVHYEQLSLL